MDWFIAYIAIPVAYIFAGGFVIIFAKLVKDWTTSYSLHAELAERDNPALAVAVAGYLLGVVAIFIGALLGPSKGFFLDILLVCGYSFYGVILLNLSRWINDRFILYQFCNRKEIIEDQNSGTGAVVFASYLASGLIVGGSVQGTGGGLHTAFVFYLLGQIVMIVFTRIYERIIPFKVHDEIERDNVAAGVAFAGAMLAIGIVLMGACSGNFISWGYNLLKFATESVALFLLLPLVRYCFDRFVFSKVDLNQEISQDKNLAAGFLEASGMVAFALIFMAALL